MTSAERLAASAVGLECDAVPPQVLRAAKLHVLDALGEDEVDRLLEAVLAIAGADSTTALVSALTPLTEV